MLAFATPLPLFECPTMDGQNFVVRGALFYKAKDGNIYCVPDGSTTDGPSIPQLLLSVISPFGYKIWGASIFHDAWFRGFLLVWLNGIFVGANHNKEQATNLFDEIMEVCGMEDAERQEVFQSVKWGGEIPFEDDLSGVIPKLIIPKQLPACYASS